MKYLITENKMNLVIQKYLDKLFPEDEMEIYHPVDYDDDGNEVYDKCRIFFTIKGMDEGEPAFIYYEKCHWTENPPSLGITPNYLRLLEIYDPPYLDIEEPFINLLRPLFGDRLDDAFKEWFYRRYKLPINKMG